MGLLRCMIPRDDICGLGSWQSPELADFVAEVADKRGKLRLGVELEALAATSLRWKRWLRSGCADTSTRLQRDLMLMPHMGRPAVAAGRRA